MLGVTDKDPNIELDVDPDVELDVDPDVELDVPDPDVNPPNIEPEERGPLTGVEKGEADGGVP